MSDPSASNIVLYTRPNTRGTRIAWLLEEMGLSYQVVQPDVSVPGSSSATTSGDADGLSASEFKSQMGALGRSPTLHDTFVNDDTGAEEKIVVQESGAIAEYLVTRYASSSRRTGSLYPTGPLAQKTRVCEYVHMAEGTFALHASTVAAVQRSVRPVLETHLLVPEQAVSASEVGSEAKTTADVKEETGNEKDNENERAKIEGITTTLEARYKTNLVQDMDWLAKELDRQKRDRQSVFLVGDGLTVADVMVGWMVDIVFMFCLNGEDQGAKREEWASVFEWSDGLRKRDAWKKAKARCNDTR